MEFDVTYQRDGYFFKEIKTHLLVCVRQYCVVHQLKATDVIDFLKKVYPDRVFTGVTKLKPSQIDSLDFYFNIKK